MGLTRKDSVRTLGINVAPRRTFGAPGAAKNAEGIFVREKVNKSEKVVRVVQESIVDKIYLVRGHKVMIDSDLAELYRVATKRLNEQVRRNIRRFPGDLMFELTAEELENLRSQNATSSWGGRRYAPLVFTEQGVAMLSSVLNSERAIQVNIAIMRAFVKLREILLTHRELAFKLSKLEKTVEKHDGEITAVFEAIRQLRNGRRLKNRR